MARGKTEQLKIPEIKLDQWQEEILNTKGNIVLCSGRQVGKSTIISKDAARYALNNKNKSVLIISAVENKAYLLFEKVLGEIHNLNKSMIKVGKDRPTKQILKLKNGSIIRCLPTGMTGYGIRGLTIDRLYADEAAFIPEAVWAAVTPMLATTGGELVLLSTPYGRRGYFYQCFQDKDNFTVFHLNTVDVANKREDPQRTSMLNFIEKEKERMTKREFAQEYLGEFVDEMGQFFKDSLITQTCTAQKETAKVYHDYVLGVDVGGQGGDESTYETLRFTKTEETRLLQVDHYKETYNLTTDTTRTIKRLNQSFNYKKIYIDDGGLGFGVYSELQEDEKTRFKTIPINNAQRAVEKSNKRRKIVRKTELYNNLLSLMENGKITLLNDPEIKQSLRSVQLEILDDGSIKISGRYTHIAEGLVRAAWAIKEKIIKPHIYSM